MLPNILYCITTLNSKQEFSSFIQDFKDIQVIFFKIKGIDLKFKIKFVPFFKVKHKRRFNKFNKGFHVSVTNNSKKGIQNLSLSFHKTLK